MRSQGIPVSDFAELMARSYRKDILFQEYLLADNDFSENLEQFGLSLLPTDYIDENIDSLGHFFSALNEGDRLQVLKESGQILSFSAVLYLLFKGLALHPENWQSEDCDSEESSHSKMLENFVRSSVLKEKTDVKEYVRIAYKDCFGSFERYCSHQGESFIKTNVHEFMIHPLSILKRG